MNREGIDVGARSPVENGLPEQAGAPPSPGSRIAPGSAADSVPLSIAQQRLWLLDQLEPHSPAYNLSAAVRLTGALDVTALRQGLAAVMRRHEVLRTTYPSVDGQVAPVVRPVPTVTLPVVDLRDVPEAERAAEGRRLVTTEAQRPFDLARGPLVRGTLLRLGEREHLLLLTLHHIVSDDRSTGILLRELSLLYYAFVTGQPSPLAELPLQYADFARWQRQWLQTQDLTPHLSYWRTQLDGAPPVLELPTDHARPAIPTSRGATELLALPASLSASLEVLSRQEGVTLFVVLLAAFQTLLSRYTGQDDVVVSSPVPSRPRPETAELVGVFGDTRVLRTNVGGNPSFRELLQRVGDVTRGAEAHAALPFEKLLEELRPERDLRRAPLFQVMFRASDGPVEPPQWPGLRAETFEFDRGIAICDLALETIASPSGLSCSFEYRTDLFDAVTISRMAGHFLTLLEGIVADPGQPIATLPLLTAAERRLLLVEWSTGPTEATPDDSESALAHELFEAQAERTPDAVAVLAEDGQLTYRELDRRANQLAHHLQASGVGPDVCVGICMERAPELVVAILGVLKAGGAYVPLDPAYPKDRLALMLDEVQAPALLTQERLLPRLPEHRATAICLDTGWEAIAQRPIEPPASRVTIGSLASVFFTSGSTGRPKAVMRPYRRLHRRRSWERETFQLAASDRHLLKTPIGFTLLSREVFWPLVTGASMIVARPGGEQDPAYLVQLIAAHGVTILSLVPSLLRVLLEEPGIERCGSLRHVNCFGEPLPVKLQERFFARLATELSIFYGTTEAPSATFWQCRRDDPRRIVGIGRPLPNKRVYVLDAHLQPVPIGVPGELHVGGKLARGYLNRPELTGERFIPDPFSEEPDARLYKTGDRARYHADGTLEFLGRADHQVKLRGVRIELGEIEATLEQHPAVGQAVAMVREDMPGDHRLVAYVTPAAQPAPTAGELRDFLKRKLPVYMLPSVIVTLAALPLTPNGKVDRGALPPPHPEPAAADGAQPATPTERLIAAIWEDVLATKDIRVDDNFFDLGGHSLLAIQVLDRLEKATGVRPRPTDLFLQSLGQLASVCDQRAQASRPSGEPGLLRKVLTTLKRSLPGRTAGNP